MLGLRLQIGLALSIAFAVAFGLLGSTSLTLARRGRDAVREREARALAATIAVAVDRGDGSVDGPRFDSVARTALSGGVRGVSVQGPRVDRAQGITGFGTWYDAALPSAPQTAVRVWLPAGGETDGPYANLLVLYIAVTGSLILLLTYVALTFLIVRPLQSMTAAARRLADGRTEIEVPEAGAGEVRQLARDFNAMGRQVRADQAQLEARLAELSVANEELDAAQEQIVRSARLASVGRLAAGVAHEIGNPLTAVVGLVELARDSDLEFDTRDELLARTTTEAERIQRIIRELLDFARPVEPAEGVVDLGEVVEDAVRLLAPQHDSRGLRIERRIEPSEPVRGSADRLKQVVLNLLLNAVDAVDGEGEVVVEVAPHGAHQVQLVVSDDGPGLDPTITETLFEPFVTTKAVGRGTGLGLAVCHTIIQRLGGTLSASNGPYGGARFEILLPCASGADAADSSA